MTLLEVARFLADEALDLIGVEVPATTPCATSGAGICSNPTTRTALPEC
ncbi:hypothetical protein [Lichenicoccus sp.]